LFTHLEDIKIDKLKKRYDRLYYFGLGFIQLKLNNTWRLHFYAEQLPPITEDIHNHRYDFVSTVMKGSIENTTYEIANGVTHRMRNESCNPRIKAPAHETKCSVAASKTTLIAAGQSYEMAHDQFHTVKASTCITLLERGPYRKQYAQIVLPADAKSVCPYSLSLPDNDLWEIIESLLK
jgi:hypothetical protein